MSIRIRATGFGYNPERYLTLAISSESPVGLTSYTEGYPRWDNHNLIREPIFFSPDRTLAKELVFANGPGLTGLNRPIAAATYEYVQLLSPAGVIWVYGLNNDGTWYLEQFDSATPSTTRRLVTTVMHKGKNLWVADNRIKPPTGGL